jgi:uncharacterized membrane protein YeaQ/YmgE (transglycosylase-associated protein family)
MANTSDDAGAVFAAILLGLVGGALAALILAALGGGPKSSGGKSN